MREIIHKKWFWFVLALASAWMYNGLDYFVSGCSLPHATADDYSYIQPGLDFWETGIFGSSSSNVSGFVQRPPLLGVLYGFMHLLFESLTPIAWLILCSLCFGASAVLLADLLKASPWKTAMLILYATFPLFSGFVAYQFSESLLPFFLIYPLWAFVRQKSKQVPWSLLLLYLLRPQALLLFLPLFVLWFVRNWKKFSGVRTWIHLLLPAIFLLAWEGRKVYYLQNEYSVHAIYSWENQSLFRPPHEGLTNLFRCWTYKPEDFHQVAVSAWDGNLDDELLRQLEFTLREKGIERREEILRQVVKFETLNQNLRKSWQKGATIQQTNAERAWLEQIELLTQRIKSENRWLSYVVTPLKSLGHLFSMSHIHQHVFQREWSNFWLVKGLKGMSLVLVWALVIRSIMGLGGRDIWYLFLGPVLYLVYLGWFQVMNEDRYLFPWIVYCVCVTAVLLGQTASLNGRGLNEEVHGV